MYLDQIDDDRSAFKLFFGHNMVTVWKGFVYTMTDPFDAVG